MKSFESFMNMDVNMKEFESIYNNYTNNKKKFTGGTIKVKDLVKNIVFEPSSSLSSKIKGGSEVIESVEARDNFFYLTKPTANFTNITSMADMTIKDNSFLPFQNIERSIVF